MYLCVFFVISDAHFHMSHVPTIHLFSSSEKSIMEFSFLAPSSPRMGPCGLLPRDCFPTHCICWGCSKTLARLDGVWSTVQVLKELECRQKGFQWTEPPSRVTSYDTQRITSLINFKPPFCHHHSQDRAIFRAQHSIISYCLLSPHSKPSSWCFSLNLTLIL